MPNEVAKAILFDKPYTEPKAMGGADYLMQIARKFHDTPSPDAWYAALEDAEVDSIIIAIGGFGSIIPLNAQTGSFREVARSMVERKLNTEMIEKMRDLESVTTRLEKRALFVGAVGVAATIVGTVIAALSLWKML